MSDEACFLVTQSSLLCPLCGHAQRRGGEIVEESRLAMVLSSVLRLRLCCSAVCVCARMCAGVWLLHCIHPSVQPMFVETLLRARNCAKSWARSGILGNLCSQETWS